MWPRSLALALIVASAAAPFAPRADAAASAPVETPDGFVSELGGKTVDLLRQTQLSAAERQARFRTLLHDDFDVAAMSRFVIGGTAWRAATEAERTEFTRLFEDYIVTAYSARLSQYSGERFTVTGWRPAGANGSLVTSQILRADGGPPTQVDWRVAGRTGSDYRINDVIVGGISLVLTQREEFASVIQHNGGRLDGLVQALRDMARR
jgi:phospholipid transport system substrate-binding protein